MEKANHYKYCTVYDCWGFICNVGGMFANNLINKYAVLLSFLVCFCLAGSGSDTGETK